MAIAPIVYRENKWKTLFAIQKFIEWKKISTKKWSSLKNNNLEAMIWICQSYNFKSNLKWWQSVCCYTLIILLFKVSVKIRKFTIAINGIKKIKGGQWALKPKYEKDESFKQAN